MRCIVRGRGEVSVTKYSDQYKAARHKCATCDAMIMMVKYQCTRCKQKKRKRANTLPTHKENIVATKSLGEIGIKKDWRNNKLDLGGRYYGKDNRVGA